MILEEARSRFLPSGRDQGMLTCPSHPDRRKSLSARVTKEKLLLHCFAGCSADAVAKALGLRLVDLFFDSKPLTAEQRRIADAAKDKARERGRALSLAAAEALDAERYVNALGAVLARLPNDHPAAEQKTAEFNDACEYMHRTQRVYEERRAIPASKGVAA